MSAPYTQKVPCEGPENSPTDIAVIPKKYEMYPEIQFVCEVCVCLLWLAVPSDGRGSSGGRCASC